MSIKISQLSEILLAVECTPGWDGLLLATPPEQTALPAALLALPFQGGDHLLLILKFHLFPQNKSNLTYKCPEGQQHLVTHPYLGSCFLRIFRLGV